MSSVRFARVDAPLDFPIEEILTVANEALEKAVKRWEGDITTAVRTRVADAIHVLDGDMRPFSITNADGTVLKGRAYSSGYQLGLFIRSDLSYLEMVASAMRSWSRDEHLSIGARCRACGVIYGQAVFNVDGPPREWAGRRGHRGLWPRLVHWGVELGVLPHDAPCGLPCHGPHPKLFSEYDPSTDLARTHSPGPCERCQQVSCPSCSGSGEQLELHDGVWKAVGKRCSRCDGKRTMRRVDLEET